MSDSYSLKFKTSKSVDQFCKTIESNFDSGFLGSWDVSRDRSPNLVFYTITEKDKGAYEGLEYFFVYDNGLVTVKVTRYSGFGFSSVEKLCEKQKNKLI